MGNSEIILCTVLILHREKPKPFEVKRLTQSPKISYLSPNSEGGDLDAGLAYQREPTKPQTSCPAHSAWHAAPLSPPLPQLPSKTTSKRPSLPPTNTHTLTRATSHGRKGTESEREWRTERTLGNQTPHASRKQSKSFEWKFNKTVTPMSTHIHIHRS